METLKFKGDFAGGHFLAAKRGAKLTSEDPGDLAHPVGEWREGDASAAIAAAKRAAPSWGAMPAAQRFRRLERMKRALTARSAAIARLITREMGKVLSESEAEVARAAARFDLVRDEETQTTRERVRSTPDGFDARVVYRPRGVVGVLAPFNLPLHLALSPAVSAMGAGNAVILKPSELTPFVGQAIAELALEADLPPGVFNLTQGGAKAGARLAEDADVDALIFTGSWATGKKVLEAAERTPGKLCALEMGGKNAAIVLKDADLDLAVRECVEGAFMTSGQRCNSTSRILVDKKIHAKFVQRFLEAADRLVVGYGLSKVTSLGPVVSRRSYEKALEALKKAKREGFEPLREGGPVQVPGKSGYYLGPSVHLAPRVLRRAPAEGTYAHDEVFGPDTAVYAVSGLDEAIETNNRGLYGLVVSVFGSKRKDFDEAVRRAKTGLVNWNAATSRSSAYLPFGGLARSGNSRPVGSFTPFVTTVPTGCYERRSGKK